LIINDIGEIDGVILYEFEQSMHGYELTLTIMTRPEIAIQFGE